MSWVIQSEEKARHVGATELDEVLYVISVADLMIAYEEANGEGSWGKLGDDEKASLVCRARSYMESFCGEGSYTFADAIAQAIEDWSAEQTAV